MSYTEKISFTGHDGHELAARMDLPATPPKAYALFAHCFSCSKDVLAASRVSRGLVDHGIAVLRFDFTGLGASEGEFENTNFSSNVQDLISAANWLEKTHGSADLLIGHSLGGAAAIVAAVQLPAVKAVATLGAPSDASHILRQLSDHLDTIDTQGCAEVKIASRPFTIKKQFVDDVKDAKVREAAAHLKRPLLILHSPYDETVGIDNATSLFMAAKHPKSFISLDHADHLLSAPADAAYAADAIAAWSERYVSQSKANAPPAPFTGHGSIRVQETGEGGYANYVVTESHLLRSDEPQSIGGLNTGPTPMEYLSGALGACTSITLRMYLNRKGWPVDQINVDVIHTKAETPDETGWKQDRFERLLSVKGDLTDEQKSKLIDIANKCPVHKSLHHASVIETRLKLDP